MTEGIAPRTETGKRLLGSILFALQQEGADVADLSWIDEIAAVEREATPPAPPDLRAALERLFEAASVEEEDWSPATHDELVAALNQAGRALAAPAATPDLRAALRDANHIISMMRQHLSEDHPDCAYDAFGVLNDSIRAALATPAATAGLDPFIDRICNVLDNDEGAAELYEAAVALHDARLSAVPEVGE
jgi:hypothetical protein